jgi:hypothetical protein
MMKSRLIAASTLFVAAFARGATLHVDAPLQFGAFAASGGAIDVSPDGRRSVSGAAGALGSSGFSPASLTVTMSANDPSQALLLPESLVLTSDGGATVTLDHVRASQTTIPSTAVPQTIHIELGATLHVAPNTPAGRFAGTFQILLISE